MNVIPQAVKDGFVRLVGPIARALIRWGVRPNVITTLGALVVLGSATAFGLGHAHLGGFLLLASGLFDILDGQVARQGTLSTAFGAFYDSTLDRVGESAIFAGVMLSFLRGGLPSSQVPLGVMLAAVALASSLLVSYTRARAEGLGFDCKVGIAARAERFIVLGAPTLFFGAGSNGQLLFWIVAVLAAVTSITVVQRVVYVARVAGRAVSATPATARGRRDTLPGHAALRKGT
ncbi:MAG TPA: CDP-alcohol phosphatidyltransferase family protein [Gemmatimonadales bacterium]|nr:CDP-alcohol phosphatidyltransferase family protein [Gemmatimonadales bacterium]